MKRSLLIFLLLNFAIISVFADKSRFFDNGKVIDTMFVDSENGLRVRDKPWLKSKRLCVLPYRFPVKIVAIGKEEKIDNITAPWIEILIPRYEWKNEEPEYGWVFGGYLIENQPEFKKPGTKEELKLYLTSFFNWKELSEWELEHFGSEMSVGYSKNDYYEYFYDKTYFDGKYKTVDSNTIEFELLEHEWEPDYEDPNYVSTPRIKKEKRKILEISENMYIYVSFDYKNNEYSEEKIMCTGWTFQANRINMDSPSLYLNDHSGLDRYTKIDTLLYGKDVVELYGSESKLNHEYLNNAIYSHEVPFEKAVNDFIKSGVSAKGTKFEQQYHEYWNPIMEEHQKKADTM